VAELAKAWHDFIRVTRIVENQFNHRNVPDVLWPKPLGERSPPSRVSFIRVGVPAVGHLWPPGQLPVVRNPGLRRTPDRRDSLSLDPGAVGSPSQAAAHYQDQDHQRPNAEARQLHGFLLLISDQIPQRHNQGKRGPVESGPYATVDQLTI